MELNLKRPLVVFDLESTGLNITEDRIIELSYVKVFPGGREESDTLRFNPEKKIPQQAIDVHGITDEDVKDKPTFKQRAHDVARVFEGSDIAGFNSNHFDIPLLAQEMSRAGIQFDPSSHKFIDVQMFIPNHVEGPVPAFLMMNLQGNACINEMESIAYPDEKQRKGYDIFGFPPRGMKRSRHPLELILSRGYAFITFSAQDVDPDFDDGYQNGVTPYIYKKGQHFPEPDQWGAISEWAWAHSRIMDYLEEAQSGIDAKRVAVALWTVAQDRRFALAVSNCSGCTGAAISRRRIGQTVRQIQTTFPHWFCLNYVKYMDNEDALPVDQHELIALCAPRPVFVTSGSLDNWADQFLGAVGAMPVYQLYGYQGLPTTEFPGVDKPVIGDRMGYHMHPGKHSMSGYDWVQYLNFADRYLK